MGSRDCVEKKHSFRLAKCETFKYSKTKLNCQTPPIRKPRQQDLLPPPTFLLFTPSIHKNS